MWRIQFMTNRKLWSRPMVLTFDTQQEALNYAISCFSWATPLNVRAKIYKEQ